ncbi:MAG: hypothetical protein PUC33_00685 [Oscillospiraceae bacterium]|nr:hypothetical protein [Oscillospiraceae bacterium]
MEIFDKFEEFIWKIYNMIADILLVFGIEIQKHAETETTAQA